MSNKWAKQFWEDLGERVGTSAVGGALAVVTANSADVIHVDTKVWGTLVVVPAAVSLLKGLLVNLKASTSGSGSASLVGTSSTKKAPRARKVAR
jgi:hypothetical protein